MTIKKKSLYEATTVKKILLLIINAYDKDISSITQKKSMVFHVCPHDY